ncbi:MULTISPECIES: MFS transporter [unclassified Phenylobacterium]|nr:MULTISPECIES: MFS transporter [unclassified Phenylobacterium]
MRNPEAAALSERDLDRGVKHLMWDAAFATAVGALNSGVVLVAYALYFDASNKVVGFIAAIPLLTQLLQAPAVLLVERLRRRRLICVASLFVARLALPIMAVLSWIPDKGLALGLLILAETIHCSFNAVAACSWNSWVRDLVPEDRLGRFFAHRTIWATAIGLAGTILAGLALERAGDGGPSPVFFALYAGGFLASLFSTWHLAQVPEQLMAPLEVRLNLRKLLRQPLRDRNFRRFIMFLASWQFAVNFATPFFTVYFLQQLGFGMAFVMTLTVVSQAANIGVLRAWGRVSDRFSNKTALGAAAPVFIACIAAMVVASQIESRATLSAYLIALHIVFGASAAGVGLASSALAMKLAPRGAATPYVAASAFLGAMAAGVAPVIGGLWADFFAARELGLNVHWRDPAGLRTVFAFSLTNWDFYFLAAALMGVYALHRLSMIDEPGEVPRQRLVEEAFLRAREGLRNASPVAGLRALSTFPGGSLIDFNQRRQAFKSMWREASAARVVWRHGSPQNDDP